MYMYYLLGLKLWATEDGDTKRGQKRLAIKSQNTFILALDGDVDFEPHALSLLVDLMKGRPKVGAACGRIHPIGSGDNIIIDYNYVVKCISIPPMGYI